MENGGSAQFAGEVFYFPISIFNILPSPICVHLWLHSWFCGTDEEGALGAEGAQFGGVAEPAAGVHVRRRGRVSDAAMRDVCEACIAKKFRPFVGRKKIIPSKVRSL